MIQTLITCIHVFLFSFLFCQHDKSSCLKCVLNIDLVFLFKDDIFLWKDLRDVYGKGTGAGGGGGI